MYCLSIFFVPLYSSSIHTYIFYIWILYLDQYQNRKFYWKTIRICAAFGNRSEDQSNLVKAISKFSFTKASRGVGAVRCGAVRRGAVRRGASGAGVHRSIALTVTDYPGSAGSRPARQPLALGLHGSILFLSIQFARKKYHCLLSESHRHWTVL